MTANPARPILDTPIAVSAIALTTKISASNTNQLPQSFHLQLPLPNPNHYKITSTSTSPLKTQHKQQISLSLNVSNLEHIKSQLNELTENFSKKRNARTAEEKHNGDEHKQHKHCQYKHEGAEEKQ
jgi:hypothetical protein